MVCPIVRAMSPSSSWSLPAPGHFVNPQRLTSEAYLLREFCLRQSVREETVGGRDRLTDGIPPATRPHRHWREKRQHPRVRRTGTDPEPLGLPTLGVDRHLEVPRLIASSPAAPSRREVDKTLRVAVAHLQVAPKIRAVSLASTSDEAPGLGARLNPPPAVINERPALDPRATAQGRHAKVAPRPAVHRDAPHAAHRLRAEETSTSHRMRPR